MKWNKAFWKSVAVVKKQWKALVLFLFIDIFFLYSYGFVSGGIFSTFGEYLTAFAMGATETTAGRVISLAEIVRQNPDLQPLIMPMIVLFILYFISVYLLYCIIQGYAWFRVKKLHEKILFNKFMLSFFKINIFWFVIYFITIFFTMLVLFQETIADQFGGEVNPLFSIIYKLFWAIFLYFAFLSYALIGSKKKLFMYGIQRWKDLVPLYIIIGAAFYAVNFIAGKILGVVGFSIIISLLLGLVLLAPVFVFGRIFLLQVVEE